LNRKSQTWRCHGWDLRCPNCSFRQTIEILRLQGRIGYAVECRTYGSPHSPVLRGKVTMRGALTLWGARRVGDKMRKQFVKLAADCTSVV
jgi:hypothetical protein